MDMRKKLLLCGIITILFDMEAYVIAYNAMSIAIPNIQMLFISRYLFMIPFYFIQICMLRYAIGLQSRLLYFFPLYWGMEIYRLVFRNLVWFMQSYENNGILNFLYKHVTAVFWTADYAFTYDRVYYYNSDFSAFSVLLLVEDILKLVVSLGAFFILCKYALHQHKVQTEDRETSTVSTNSHISIEKKDTYQKIKRKFIRSGLLIIIYNIVAFAMMFDNWSYMLFYPIAYSVMLILKYAIAISYFVLQILFLYYAIKLGGKIICLFPFYWIMEIWRLVFRNTIGENLHYRSNILWDVMYKYITRFFWAADWLPCTHCFLVDYHDFPMRVWGEDVIKMLVSLTVFIISCRHALIQCKEGFLKR